MNLSGQEIERRLDQDRDDIHAIYEILTDIARTQDQHTATLDGHSAILAEHTATLDGHSAILAEHSVALGEIKGQLSEVLHRLPEPPAA